MDNLFKNTLRSLKHNKVAVIGLTFLTFLAVGTFTLLNSVTTNIQNEYTSISKKNNLHDFTINEKYNIGNPQFGFIGCNKDYIDMTTSDPSDLQEKAGWFGTGNINVSNPTFQPYNFAELSPSIGISTEYDGDGNPTGHNFIPWLYDDGSGTHSYRMELQLQGLDTDSILFQQFKKLVSQSSPWTDPLWELFFPVIVISSANVITYENRLNSTNNFCTTDSYSEVLNGYTDASDIFSPGVKSDEQSMTLTLTNASTAIINFFSNNDTPIQHLLDDPNGKYFNQVQYRKFRSLDINNSPDKVYYKTVISHPETDRVDKMNLFSGIDNFKDEDFNLDGIQQVKNNQGVLYTPSIDEILSYKVSSSQPTLGTDDYARSLNKFIVINKGDVSGGDWQNTFSTLASGDFSNYIAYYNLQKTEIFYNKGYRYTFNWQDGSIPISFALTNWTSKFTVLAPQYANKHNLVPFSSDIFTKYAGWTGQYPNNKLGYIDWFNSLNTSNFINWFNWVEENYPHSILNEGGGTPYIICGLGITADFLYPIVSIERSTPNFSNESINFVNETGYSYIYDSFRGNPTENYLVCKAINGANVKELINDLNIWATNPQNPGMNWPAGTTCVYGAIDIRNHLSAAAFRISFIPELVSAISLVDYLLTMFILLLCIVIAATVIKRYIDVNRVNIGIAQANGMRKRKIALSLLPFGIIASAFGAIIGYLAGLFLQIPTLSLLSNYWTIPTATLGFDWISLVVMFFVPFLIFTGLSFLFVYFLLRVKTTYLMKTGSEYKTNLVSRYIKKPFGGFSITTRFRISLAFNSMWKLVVLCSLTGIAMSALLFGISVNGKFNIAMDMTYSAKKYTYATDLYTPTSQGGQYIPVDSQQFAQNGWITTSEGTNFMPGVYYQDATVKLTSDTNPQSASDKDYEEVLKDTYSDEINHAIAKSYNNVPASQGTNISIPIIGNLVGAQSTNTVELFNAMEGHQNSVYPAGADAIGQRYDLQYLKNRTITKSVLNYEVGANDVKISSYNIMTAAKTNPWNFAASLMPENQLNQLNNNYDVIMQLAALKTLKTNADGSYPKIDIKLPFDQNQCMNPYDPSLNPEYTNDWNDYLSTYSKYFDIVVDQNNNGHYELNKDECLSPMPFTIASGIFGSLKNTSAGNANLKPEYIKFLNQIYSDLQWPRSDGTINMNDTAINHDYLIQYNSIPLDDTDETYTYLDVSGTKIKNKIVKDSTHIVGVKENTKYINLIENNKDIKNKLFDIPSNFNKTTSFPIVVNAYAAKKYGLNKNDVIKFNVNNSTDRYDRNIRNVLDIPTANFKVVGICSMYIGEEYYISQDAANYLLGLKSHLLDNLDASRENGAHSYYPDTTKSIQITNENLSILATTPSPSTLTNMTAKNDVSKFPDNYATDGLQDGSTSFGIQYDTEDLYDLSDNDPNTKITNDIDGKNITPYGFNGVFTDNLNADSVLTRGINLYSLSGIYPGNDKMSAETLTTLLKYGANMQITSQILGLWNGEDNPNNIELGNNIYSSWEAWKNTNYVSYSNPNYIAMINYLPQLINVIVNNFGSTSVVSLVQNSNDKLSTKIILDNATRTIDEIETIVLCVIAIMLILIIMLLTSLIVNDSKKLSGVLKALGIRDHTNIVSFLSIYAPTIIVGGLLSIPLAIAVVSLFNSIIFNTLGIYILTNIKWWYYFASAAGVYGIFLICGFLGYRNLKKDKITELIKGV